MHLGFMLCTVLLHNSLSNLHVKDDTLFSTLFLDSLVEYIIYTHHCPLPMTSSGETDDKSTVSAH